MQKEIISYEQYGNLCNLLGKAIKKDSRKIVGVYGIPRGGVGIALHISHYLNIPYITDNLSWPNYTNEYIVICDDIADSGKTLCDLEKIHTKLIFATLFYKSKSVVKPDYYVQLTDSWIVFPWENDNSVPSQFHQEMYPDLDIGGKCAF
jgi:hypoxanthine phosphoribosyltransferase